MSFPCPSKLTCEGSDDPIRNLSSEGYDQRSFFCIVRGNRWRDWCCTYVCESTVSQEDANLCCFNRAVTLENGYCSSVFQLDGTLQCQDPDSPTCTTDCDPPLPLLYWNTEQCATLHCADGSSFVWCVPAHVVSATSQEEADAIALSMANNTGAQRKFCCSPTSMSCCANGTLMQQVSVSGGTAPYAWTITGGSFPTGVSMASVSSDDSLMQVSGTPTTAGLYTVSLQITDGSGGILTGDLHIGVLQLMPLGLPDAEYGVPYSQQLSVLGLPTGSTATFAVTSGSLPAGLTLSASGLISGTPTGNAAATFTVGYTVT